MTVTVITKDAIHHVHALVDKFNINTYYSLYDGNKKSFDLYGYNFYKYYYLKDILDIKIDIDAI